MNELPQPIAVVGAGRAAEALAAELVHAGARVRLWARRPAAGKRAAAAARATAVSELDIALAGAELLLIAVSDDALEELAGQLAARWPAEAPKVVLHAAGARSSAALAPLTELGCSCGVFHPVIALQGADSLGAFTGAFVTLSGAPAAVEAGDRLARALWLEPLVVDDAKRPLVHLAAVMAAGDVCTWLGEAAHLLEDAGVESAAARVLLGRLAESAARAFGDRGPAALTGPVPRADLGTIRAHLGALGGRPEAGERVSQAHRELLRLGAEQLHADGRLGDEELRALLALAKERD